jgi:hypothetical protein
MKNVFIISAIALSGLFYKSANAQIGVHVGFGFAPRRVYPPVEVVDQPQQYNNANDDYYYLPEVDAYYNVYEQCYYYFDGENWVSAAYLPGDYSNYDWRNAPRYEVRAVRPYLNADFYRNRFHGREVMAWRSRGYGNRANEVYANRGYRQDDQHFDNRNRGGYSEQMNPREDRGRNEHFDNRHQDNSFQRDQTNTGGRENREQFDNHMGDRFQPNRNGQRDNQRQFDNHMDNRPQPNQNEGRGNQNWGGQHFDNHRQNNFEQPNQNHGEQNRGGHDFQRNNSDNNQHQQAPNGGHENQNRGGGQQHREGGRVNEKMA